MTNASDPRDVILAAMLPHVVFDGWSNRALDAGTRDAGLEAEMAERAFPRGLRDVAAHFNEYIDRQMMAEAENRALADMPVRERIYTLVRLRLELLAPHKEAVRKVLAYLALPGNARIALRSTQTTVSRMWYAAGDTATDYNYYTKRGLLAGLYSATVLYWLADESEDFADTWNFLERRIENVMAFPKLQGRLLKVAERFPSPLRIMRRLSAAR